MAYYYDIWFLFLLFLLIFLIVLILLPKYVKKDLVPPLSDANYNIRTPATAIFNPNNSNAITFEDLVFEDGLSSGTSAIDFGGDAIDSSTISYIPYYSEAHKRLIGYFDLNIGTSAQNTLAFRAVDKNSAGGNTLASYNRGWTTLNTPDMRQNYSVTPVYNVKVPFNIPGNGNDIHKLTVQISRTADSMNNLELSSSYLYYFSV